MKTCSKCGEPKDESEYSKRKNLGGRLRTECKSCQSKINKAWRVANKEHVDNYTENRDKEKLGATNKRWRERHPDKVKELAKARWLRDRERISEAKKAWRQKNPDKCKASDQRRKQKIRNMDAEAKEAHLAKHAFAEKRRKYGTDGRAELEAQGGVCAICKVPLKLRQRGTDIDHCHASGLVRGVLCHRCNVVIGFAEDRPSILRDAAKYLESTGVFT